MLLKGSKFFIYREQRRSKVNILLELLSLSPIIIVTFMFTTFQIKCAHLKQTISSNQYIFACMNV